MPHGTMSSNSDDSKSIKPVSAAAVINSEPESVFYVINPKSKNAKVTALPQNSRVLVTRKPKEQDNQNNNKAVVKTAENKVGLQSNKVVNANDSVSLVNVNEKDVNVTKKKDVHTLPMVVQPRQINRIDEKIPDNRDGRKVAQMDTKRRTEAAVAIKSVKSIKSESIAKKPENRIHPVKKLRRRFRQNGLGIADAAFNARFFYYLWKFENSKKRGGDGGRYLAYMKVMTAVAKIYGAFADLLIVFAPLIAAFKPEPNAERARGKWLKRTVGTLVPLGVMALTAVLIVNISGYRPEFELWVDDERVGIVASREVATRAMRTVELNIAGIVGEPQMFAGTISYRVVLMRDPDYLTEREIRQALQLRSQNYIMRAYGLYIDGELVGATTAGSYIDETLSQILGEIAYRVSDDTEIEDVDFANDIVIKRRDYARRDVLSGEEFVNIVTYTAVAATMEMIDLVTVTEITADSQDIHDIGIADIETADDADVGSSSEINGNYMNDDTDADEDGDSGTNVASVAAAVNISRDAINALPRGGINAVAEINESSVFAQVARSSAGVAGVQVIRTHLETDTEEIPFETQTIESDEHYVGTEIVRSEGAIGFRVTTSEVSVIGDEEVSREVINVEIVTAPETRVIVIGIREIPPPPPPPPTEPTGRFIRPVRGRISQYFSGSHRGIDIPAPFGTPILAADGGTVISAGWGGSFGNYVQISHSNGYATLYAHMSSIGVQLGDRVYQGQEIGRVGSTGRSTGNHLHFEVTRNGVLVNPLNYIPR